MSETPDLPQGFLAGGLYCYPTGDSDAGIFEYVPGLPRIDREDGRLRATLMQLPSGAVFACETVWAATEEEVAAAVEAIRAARPDLDYINLQIADLGETTATLVVTPDDGDPATLGPSTSSGWSSYRTVFQETLSAAQAEAVAAALEGKAGVLTLEYSGSLELHETAAVEIAGDLAPLLRALATKPPPAPDAFATAVDRALADGTLTLTLLSGAGIPEARLRTLHAKARAAIAQDLRDRLPGFQTAPQAAGGFMVRRKFSERVRVDFDIRRTADLGAA